MAELDLLTVAAAGALATMLGVAAHELAHALVGARMGGVLVSLSSTGVEGYWSSLRNAGWLLLGVSGSMANVLLAVSGWLIYRRSVGRPGTGTLVGWSLFVVNAWVPTLYLIASPALGFGDWMDVLSRFAALGPVRVSAAVTGLFMTGLLWRATTETLARLVGGGAANERTARARQLTRIVWVAGGVVAIAAGALAPSGALRGAGIALGSTMGSTWPLLIAAERVGDTPVPGSPLSVPRSIPLVASALVLAAAFVFLLGPGVRFD